MSIFKKLGWFFKQEKKSYIIGVFSLMMVALVQLVPPKVIGVVVDEIVNKEIRLTKIIVWVALLIGAGLAQYLFRYIWRMHIWGSAARLEKELRTQLFHHFTKMDSIFYQKYRTGDLMAHATNDLNAIQNVAGAGILTFADSVITGGTTIIAMVLFVDWRLTLIALLPLPLLAVTSRVLGSKLHDAFRDSQAAFSAINDKTQESITGIKVIKTFGQEKEDLADFTEKIDDAIVKNKRTNFLDALFDPFITLIIGVSYVLTIIIGGRFIMEGTISLGQLVSFIAYIGMLVWPMFAIGRLFNVLERGNASYDRVNELLHEKTHIIERKDAIKTMAQGTISMKIDSFSYPKEEAVALENIQFSLQEGETLGIVGKTGAGKTTILKLLMREYDQYQGTISFGKHNIKNYTLDALMGAMGYVPQDHFLFSMTVRDNIRFAKPDLEQAAVEQAAALAFINQEIKAFPEGYDTMVGERGVSLSGGQKQRLCIARMLTTNPKILIFDEPCSSLDLQNTLAIENLLKNLSQNYTIIISTHNTDQARRISDRILFIEDKKLVEYDEI